MSRKQLATASLLALWTASGTASSMAAELVWEVESPFRLFKTAQPFAMHENAFKAIRGDGSKPMPNDIIWQIERRLNDPDCKNKSTPDTCSATRGPRYEQSRLGWAAQTLPVVCYESNGTPRRYPQQCERKYSWGSAKEDYVLPEAHTVNIGLSADVPAEGECVWSWQPRKAGGKAGGKAETRKLACKNKLTISRVPFSLDRAQSGVAVSVKLPDGTELTDVVAVDDVLVVAMGDSFASGESNPDRPVTFSGSREMLYDPAMQREQDVASLKPNKLQQTYKIGRAHV